MIIPAVVLHYSIVQIRPPLQLEMGVVDGRKLKHRRDLPPCKPTSMERFDRGLCRRNAPKLEVHKTLQAIWLGSYLLKLKQQISTR